MENQIDLSTPTHQEASQWLGKLASIILIRNNISNFDYAKIGIVRDAKKGIHFAQSLAKLSVQWAKMSPFEHKVAGLVSQYVADGGEEYADDPKFMVGLMGRIPQDSSALVTPKRLREIRQRLGLSQEEFSLYLGAETPSRSGIAEWERGSRAIPFTVIEILRLKGQL